MYCLVQCLLDFLLLMSNQSEHAEWSNWGLETQPRDPASRVALFLAGPDFIANTRSLVTCLSC